VFLDGYELGWTKNGRFSTSVRGGRRWLVILAPGYVPYVEEVVLEPGETLVVQADLRRVRY
ncbi:MAG TPA: PEGA domain-containing protein, partial [Oceanithermus sp.]|nr:PEGA domain-containing protein [Oceanithermus sp.]